MKILYEGKYDDYIYYNIIKDAYIYEVLTIQTIFPTRPCNHVHCYKGSCFNEADKIRIYEDDEGEIRVNAI